MKKLQTTFNEDDLCTIACDGSIENVFPIRTSKPQAGNKYYITIENGGWNEAIKGKPLDKDCDVLANCVGYANGRFAEIQNLQGIDTQLICNAEDFIEVAKDYGLEISNVPTIGGIMVWRKGNLGTGKDGVGHVAIVERIINPNTIYTSESGYGSFKFANMVRKNHDGNWGMDNSYDFRGCIVNPIINIKL